MRFNSSMLPKAGKRVNLWQKKTFLERVKSEFELNKIEMLGGMNAD